MRKPAVIRGHFRALDGRGARHRSRCAAAALAVLGAVLSASAPGQALTPAQKQRLRDDGREVFGRPPSVTAPPGEVAREDGWSIVLASFREGDHASAAREAMGEYARVYGLRDLRVETIGEASIVACGRYSEHTLEQGREELARIRALRPATGAPTVVGGADQPFAFAVLAPVDRTLAVGQVPRYHLLRAREEHGPSVEFTLQVAVYGRDELERPTEADLAEARRAAETAAADLRRQGEEAYYYHGPRRSMVTIGAFSESDIKPSESPAVRRLRSAFPYNLYNGRAVLVRSRVKPAGPAGKPAPGSAGGDTMQRSELVLIPKS